LTVAFQRREGRWSVVQEHLSDLPTAPAADRTAGEDAPGPAEHHH
jgi:hypothetical protein